MKYISFSCLDMPKLIKVARALPLQGYVEVSLDNLVYLDIDDDFIHKTYPMLLFPHIRKPNYFNENPIGAHISIIYPEEKIYLLPEDMHQKHQFDIEGLYSAILFEKKYFVLKVKSLSLTQLRLKYNLHEKPCYKKHSLEFHITIALDKVKLV
jgi:hypothetical protein